jgi:Na+/proline symporter
MMLPHWAVVIAVVLVISVIMSTADTEIFLLSGMTLREILRLRGLKESSVISQKQSIRASRILMIIITCSAVLLSLVFRELVLFTLGCYVLF